MINTMEQNDNIIGYDFQGWPVRKKTLREVLIALGGKENEGQIVFNTDDMHMFFDAYPRTMEDDGMAYDINPQYITEVDIDNGNVTFWLDKEHPYNPKEEEE